MSTKQFTIIGSFFANGVFLDNNYLYFDLPDSELLQIEKLISEEFNIQKFKKVKYKKNYTNLYYSSEYLKKFLRNYHLDSFNKLSKEEFEYLVKGFGKQITINSIEILNNLCLLLDLHNISYTKNNMTLLI